MCDLDLSQQSRIGCHSFNQEVQCINRIYHAATDTISVEIYNGSSSVILVSSETKLDTSHRYLVQNKTSIVSSYARS